MIKINPRFPTNINEKTKNPINENKPNEHQPINIKETNKELSDIKINEINNKIKSTNKYIERSIHEVTKSIIYTVKDIETDEIIYEFPSRKIEDIIAKIWEISGLIIDEKM